MRKVGFAADEYWPCYNINDDFYSDVYLELTDEEIEDFHQAMIKFEEWQDRIQAAKEGKAWK